ncbi:rho GTPase-activating protein 27 [Chanos chanos]|uniref:Rho GTPase-activating protein 27 n=1 Tax=Chanos chanos TaxID=29144 RepID=A0A6J2VFP5_CHACN|nr:rho GTPase-activating protein 27-like [Chanos chanos]
MSITDLVLVNFEYEYETRDGKKVSIKPNEQYILIAKTNDHWWHVRKDETTKPFYIPAKYVTELPPEDIQTPLAPPVEFSGDDNVQPCIDTTPTTPPLVGVTLRVPKSIKNDTEKNGQRISTFTIPQDLYKSKLWESENSTSEMEVTDFYMDVTQFNLAHKDLSKTTPPDTEETVDSLPPAPQFSSDDAITTTVSTQDKPQPTLKLETGSQWPESQPSLLQGPSCEQLWELMDDGIYESIPEVQLPEPKVPEEMMQETEQAVSAPSAVAPVSPPAEAQDEMPESFPDPPAPEQVEHNDESLTAVYVNVSQIRKSIAESPPTSYFSSSSPEPPSNTLDTGLEGWEVHTDSESGQEYYYHPASGRTTWDHPLNDMDPEGVAEESSLSPKPCQSLPQSPEACSPPRKFSGWERLLDESTGQHYFFNRDSGQSSWDPPEGLQPPSPPSMDPRDDGPPPLPEEDYPAEEDYPSYPPPEPQEPMSPSSCSSPSEYSLAHVKRAVIPRACLDRTAPAGWTLHVDPDGTWVFTSDYTQEQWIKSLDERGQTYYYLRDGSQSQWNLPEVRQSHSPSQCRLGNGGPVEPDGMGVMRNWRHSMGSTLDEHLYSTSSKFHPAHHRNVSDYSSDASSSPETQHQLPNLEKAGILNKTKVSENGKKVRKNWAQSWTVLHGGVLTFHKDPKSAPSGGLTKTNQIVPEFTVELKGAVISKASKDKSSKKNVLELKSRNGSEFLIQYDTESIINDWYNIILETIQQLDIEQHSDNEDDVSEKLPSTDRESKLSGTLDRRRISTAGKQPSVSSIPEMDQKKVRTKLRKFLLKRPTPQSIREKGYLRDNVFGCHLATLCDQEKSTVPSFVEKCIHTVEERGLGIDGIYRVSGNLAVIQKLRHKADHEDLDLNEGHWDIHVITGALKLFFRELQEPLFPYSHFNNFVQAIKIPDRNTKVAYMSDLVKSLPKSNHDTMRALFRHLRNVIEHGDENRMTVQNVAIVFGPTLLRPEMESPNITMYMIFQNQIVEFILNEYENIF